jgi:hypothetical protein
MLLNIRDVLTLSDPRDTTKPNPWSLDSSFDVRYGLGGMNEITLGQIGPSADPPVSADLAIPIGAREWSRGGKPKARDEEESGVDAGTHDPDDEGFDRGGLEDGAASAFANVFRKGPSQASHSSPTWVQTGDAGTNLNSLASPSNTFLRPQSWTQGQGAWMDEGLEKGEDLEPSECGSGVSGGSIGGAGASGASVGG